MTLRAPLLTALLCLSSALTPALAQATPDALAQALQAAARAGDAPAYRALLAPSGTFAVEGSNFAADLARRPQPDVTYRLTDVREAGAQASARLNLSWSRVSGELSRATLPVQLRRVDNVWRYAGEAFDTVPVAGATLLALQGGGLAGRAAPLAALLPRAAAQVETTLGLKVPANVTVKVYPDAAALSASVALSMQPVSGWTEPGEAIKLVLPDLKQAGAEAQALRTLSHEFAHAAVVTALGEGQIRVPWWLHEGLAERVAQTFWTPATRRRVQEDAARFAAGNWVPLADLADFNKVAEGNWAHTYRQGFGVVEFLAATRSPDAPLRLARAFAATGQADAAARAVGFASFGALETGARSWLSTEFGGLRQAD
jgi:hypothetical protein